MKIAVFILLKNTNLYNVIKNFKLSKIQFSHKKNKKIIKYVESFNEAKRPMHSPLFNIYLKPIDFGVVCEEHLDEMNHVNNVQYLQWVQDVAEEHWLKKTSDEIRAEYYWIMLSHFIQYKAEALLHLQ